MSVIVVESGVISMMGPSPAKGLGEVGAIGRASVDRRYDGGVQVGRWYGPNGGISFLR